MVMTKIFLSLTGISSTVKIIKEFYDDTSISETSQGRFMGL
jgi:hypothetical protein